MTLALTTADWLVLCAVAFVAGIGCGCIGLALVSSIMLRKEDTRDMEVFWLDRKDDFVDRDALNAASRRRT